MAILTTSNNSASAAVTPDQNMTVQAATQAAAAVTNDAVGPLAVALNGASATPSSTTIVQTVTNDPIKYAVFAAMIWIGYKWLKRRV